MPSRRTQSRQQRPTEKASGVAGAVAALVCWLFKIDDPGVFAALAVVLGAVPAAATHLVEWWIDREPE